MVRHSLRPLPTQGLIINPIIYAELCSGAATAAVVDAILQTLQVGYQELPREALFLASKAHLAYRRRGGTRTSPLPDFFIGAHAEVAGLTLLTRDKGRYTTYFPRVTLICP